jgi:hypothetical protein
LSRSLLSQRTAPRPHTLTQDSTSPGTVMASLQAGRWEAPWRDRDVPPWG